MTLEENLEALAIGIGTDVKDLRLRTGVLANLDTTDKDSLVDAVNEVFAAVGAGGATNLDQLTDVTITSPATGHVIRFNGTTWVNVVGTDHFQAASADLDALDFASTSYGRAFLELVNQAGLVALLPTGSSSARGLWEAADDTEALAMSATDRVLTPGNLSAITNVNNGLVKLDGSGKVASAQLPAFVDDVVEAANFAALPGTGETGKIYVTLDDNKTFRWSGSAYVEISASPGSTDAVTEGSTNLYFTNARADTRADGRITALLGDPDEDLLAAYTTARDS